MHFPSSARPGVVLYVTLVVLLMIGLLSAGLGLYTHAQLAGQIADRQSAQACEAAQAGVALAEAVLLDPARANEDLLDNPELFGGVLVVEGDVQWRVSLLRDRADDDKSPAYGLTDESGKLNINAAVADQFLAAFADSGMTPQIAEAIIDWRDRDDAPRANGAERDTYEQLAYPYAPKNGPFESVAELLLVRGVTEALLYGEDLNRNGILDPNEDDGDKSLPPDNADGRLDRGWFPYLTVYSIEFNRTADGSSRINVNSGSPDQVYSQMIDRGFSESFAGFVRDARRGGVLFTSVAQMVGWTGQVGSGGSKTQLTSPLGLDELPKALAELSGSSLPLRLGRVNPAAADPLVLRAIGFTDQEAASAVDVRSQLAPDELATYAWLLGKGVLSADRFKELADRLTGRGAQFRIEAVGYSTQSGLFRRVETVIDIGQGRPRTMYWRDLTGLGSAYVLASPDDLAAGTIRAGR